MMLSPGSRQLLPELLCIAFYDSFRDSRTLSLTSTLSNLSSCTNVAKERPPSRNNESLLLSVGYSSWSGWITFAGTRSRWCFSSGVGSFQPILELEKIMSRHQRRRERFGMTQKPKAPPSHTEGRASAAQHTLK